MAQETHDTVMSELDIIKKQQIDNKKSIKEQHKTAREVKEIVMSNRAKLIDVQDDKGIKVK